MKRVLTYLGFSAILFVLFFISTASEAHAATLYISPASGNQQVGNILSVSVLVNAQGQAINNADAVINFPANLLEVVSVSKSGSIFSLWVEEPAFSNSAGTITFNGGLPTPGYSGTAGKIIGIVFRMKSAGSASLVFSSAAVRANDGLGTDVLSATQGASYAIGPASTATPVPPTTPPPTAPSVNGFAITSPTHPDSNTWYSNNDPVFRIAFPSGTREINLVLSRNGVDRPMVRYAPPISERSISDVDDGVWYLHANYRDSRGVLSQTITFKFQVDTTPPERIDVIPRATNPHRRFELLAIDSVSGISHFEARIDDGEWIELTPDDEGLYPVPIQTPGTIQLTVRAYDQAGNYIESTPLELQIEAPPAPEAKPTWYLSIIETFRRGIDTARNVMMSQWVLWLVLLAIGALIGHVVAKVIRRIKEEIERIRYVSAEYRAQRKLKRHDRTTKRGFRLAEEFGRIRHIAAEYRTQKKLKKHVRTTKQELKKLQKDIKTELDLINKLASLRPLRREEENLRSKLEEIYHTLKK